MTHGEIMIVEDEAVTAMALQMSVTNLGYHVAASVSSGEEAIATARGTHLDVILMDIRLKGRVDGIHAAETIRRETDVPSIYLTANSDQETLQRAKIAEPYGYLLKPYNEKELRAAIEIALHMSGLERDRRRAEAALESREALLQQITDNSPSIIYTKDAEERYTLVNRKFEDAFATSRATVRGKEDHEVLPAHDALTRADRAVLAEGKPSQADAEVASPTGPRTYSTTRFPLRGADGAIEGVCAILTDVTDLKRAAREARELKRDLELRVAERTRSLALANQQLEAFNHTVAHDLRGPVRGIEHLTEALAETVTGRLSPDERQLMDTIRSQSQKLGELLNDLMIYSQSSGGVVDRVDIDVSARAGETVSALRRGDPTRQVDVQIAPGITCAGDALLLQLVLENIIGNAWKYTSRTPAALIQIGSARGPDGRDAIFVKDNGAGFDAMAASRLFQPFQRLHLPSEFPGTGLGLSSARRIIERHGGRMWAEGKLGAGATFWFQL